MNMLTRKKRIGICFFIIIFIVSLSNDTQAETSFVNDCLDENPDCLEELGNAHEKDQEEEQTNNLVSDIGTKSLGFSMVRMVLSLLLILALMYVLLKFLSKRQNLSNQVKSLENLGGISVGQHKSIQIVRVGTKVYMIGVGENVEMLQEITDEELIDDLLHKHVESQVNTGGFIKALFQKTNNQDTGPKSIPNQNFANLFSQELEKLKQTRRQMKNQQVKKEDTYE